ncbi:MAG: flavodoxin domain-containing protein [Methanomassiliicoccus sp.]|nr:flavodoxin domain-containing protein [Methanomassiliicoccus sp.]
MRVEIYHGSKYGNGARVAEEIRRLLVARNDDVSVHHMSEASPKDPLPAELYILGSPTHFGKAPGNVIRFLKRLTLPPGTRYAVFATLSAPRPDKVTGRMPTEEELQKLCRTLPMIDEQLRAKGMVKVAEMAAFVDPESMKGPLVEGWEKRVGAFVNRITSEP